MDEPKLGGVLSASPQRRRRHQCIADQGQWLKSVVSDSFAYHAVPTNGRTLSALRYYVVQIWLRSLTTV